MSPYRHSSALPAITKTSGSLAPYQKMALAIVLLEVAKADHEISPVEVKKIRELLTNALKLTAEELQDILAAAEAIHKEGHCVESALNVLEEFLSASSRLVLVDMLKRVAKADGKVTAPEKQLTAKLAHLLGV